MKSSDPQHGNEYSSAAAESSVSLHGAPGLLDQILVTNNTATAGYVMLFDATSAPSAGTTPKVRFPLPADPGAVALDFPKGIRFSKGCWARISTTVDTLTVSSDGAWFYAVFTGRKKS